ncbi:Glutamine-binding periplasmic protein precursor [Delftia tsuruhatensis]|uniref:transporter substrate-binding domain-containing protein n=1 Tax=Delftia tsuruhatensis TaxID=180282 RepID=UPI001E79E0F9|nr:transporter substrate-binding domain-containing protein [Delftia tsuruhatensis]CAB5678205.1 Glutamine-binding periplasmic protein precursor [Delftia tsuruhatensis]CAC9693090.1 Glutamine-binding periplasmic protein precursor [Delftia tsuruhatensis]
MTPRIRLLLPTFAMAALTAFGPHAHADQLADIQARGRLVCAVLGIFEPFGYTDPQTRGVAGYDVDICHAVGQRLGVKAEIRPVADEARIPELQRGHADLLAAGLAHTPERAAQVDYSHAYYTSRNVLAVNRQRGYRSTGELAGKRISYVKGTISEPFIRAALPTARPVGYDDVSTAFAALLQGKVEAFSTSEEAVRRLVHRLGTDAARFAVLGTPIGNELWSIGVRKGEKRLLAAVNTALQDMEASGEMQAIFDRWLGQGTLYGMSRTFTVRPIP